MNFIKKESYTKPYDRRKINYRIKNHLCVHQDSKSEPLVLYANTTNEATEHSKIVVHQPDMMIVSTTTERASFFTVVT